jgi:hypothetical protein
MSRIGQAAPHGFRLLVGAAVVCAVATFVAGCASTSTGGTDGTDAASATAAQPAAAPTKAATVSAPAVQPSAEKTSDGSGGDDGSFTMPNEVGQGLQDAQDDIQRVSGDPVFVSHSHDLLGSRMQVLDSNWQVCSQNVPAGSKASAVEHIDFGVVKLDESCP